tara:strand:+ start:4269 stop:6404 length:2136 start_codon:yes stop_codon:yes gene_type:complete
MVVDTELGEELEELEELEEPSEDIEDVPGLEGDEFGEEENDHARDYWAREEDPRRMVEHIMSRVEEYRTYQRQSQYFAWIIKNWQYCHGLFWDEESFAIGTTALGEQGDLVGLTVNHMRNLVQHIVTLTTRDRPAFAVRAKNADPESLDQARLGKSIVENYLTEKQGETYLRRCVEHALVFAEGYLLVEWDPSAGHEIDADEDTLELETEGDVSLWNLNPWDVFRDLGVLEWEKNSWIGVRLYANRWNLITRYPEHRDAILACANSSEDEDGNRPLWTENSIYQNSDQVEIFKFYHAKCDALPEGREVLCIPGALLDDDDLIYDEIPVMRLTPGELLLSPFGYTPAFDLQGIQEAINAEYSTTATNHAAFGVQKIWSKTSNNLRRADLDELVVVQSEEKPEPLQLTEDPRSAQTFRRELEQASETISGVNSVARGQPEASLKSGAALALIDAKAVQSASTLIHGYHRLLEKFGTKVLQLVRDFSRSERVVAHVGRQNIIHRETFSGSQLDGIDRVVVESINPALSTFAGRVEVANHLLDKGMIATPEQYLTVMQTGNIEPLTQSETSQLQLIERENDDLMNGRGARASEIDNHVLHIKEHHALLGSPEIRNSALASEILAHLLEHKQLLQDLSVQELQAVLGYKVPLPATHVGGAPIPPPAPGAPGGAGGAGGVTPKSGEAPPDIRPPDPGNPMLDERSMANLPDLPEIPT